MRTQTRPTMSVIAGLTLLALAANGCTSAEPTSARPDNAAVAAVVPSPTSGSVAVGGTMQLAASARDAQGQPVSGATISWTTDNSSIATVNDGGLVTGKGAGTVAIFAKSGSATGTATITVNSNVTPGPVAGDWTFCVNAGSMCTYTGLRRVRLGGPSGPFVEQTAWAVVPCAVFGFEGRNPARDGEPLHCDYGPLMIDTLTNPMPGMGGLGATVVIPLGEPGATGPKLAAGTPVADLPGDGSFGAFRTTCSLAKFAFDDPIVYPGQSGASHLHIIFGNTAVTASTTPETLKATGNSTCRGGTLNRTAYWMPAVYDTRTGAAVVPEEGVFYYKTGYSIDPKTVKPFPAGLRMIAGNKNATGPQDYVDWDCRDHSNSTGPIPSACPVGDAIRLTILFPQCWDGVNLDSPDHKSHMAYPNYANPPFHSTCPPSHPVTLPEITEHFDFPITSPGASAFWRLSSDMYSTSIPGGYSAHADWMNGWDPATMQGIVTNCLNKGLDCGVGNLGNGKALD